MMSQNYGDVALINLHNQFQLPVDGATAFIDYRQSGNELILIHTEVPEEIEGRGVAAALVEKTLEWAESNGWTIVPRCTYIIEFLRRHPAWNRIVKHG